MKKKSVIYYKNITTHILTTCVFTIFDVLYAKRMPWLNVLWHINKIKMFWSQDMLTTSCICVPNVVQSSKMHEHNKLNPSHTYFKKYPAAWVWLFTAFVATAHEGPILCHLTLELLFKLSFRQWICNRFNNSVLWNRNQYAPC